MRQLVIWVAALTTLALVCAFDPRAFRYLADAKVGRAQADIRILSEATEAYRAKQGKYPETLKELVDGGYVKHESGNPLVDPWGSEYRCDPKGKRNGGKKPDVWAVTPDAKEIGNWPEEKK